MANVKVVPRSLTEAYKKREGDFSPNLVGNQFTDGVSFFTLGNFQITTTISPRISKDFVLGGQWSDYYNLDNLDLSESQSESLVSNNIFAKLNFDINNISRYVYFGSFREFSRVTIEQIIQKWKGSIYLNPTFNSNVGSNTVLGFKYDSGNNTTTFLIPKTIISNPYELIVDNNTDFEDLQPSDIFNLTRDYYKYVISNGNGEFNVIGYTGSTSAYQYMGIQVVGNPFPSLSGSTFGQLTYHLKPNNTEVESFFNQLTDFEGVVLNRLTTPKYTITLPVPTETDGGIIIYNNRTFSWPVTDGYNLDISGTDYANYVENIINNAEFFDKYKTDIVSRRFVAESIHEFDTNGGGDEIYGRKVNKLLKIYGREFDEIKKYIDGISFANVVTYNKLDNTSDELIKIMAKTLGFDVLLTVITDNFNLTQQNEVALQTVFSGYSRTLSSKELDVELWRRLVINAWWLWKSKGTRKVIEFFLTFFNIPQCMVSLDEFVYLAENRLDRSEVYAQLTKIYEINVNLEDYPIDDYGFPRILPETNNSFFQMNGFWYNGGSVTTLGNNPHIGDYDYGKSYFQQFECLVPNFNDLLTGSSVVTVNTNYFNNYNEGTFVFDQNGLPVPFYGNGYATTLNNEGLVTNATVNNAGLTYVGGSNSPKYNKPNGDSYSMKLSFTTGTKDFCLPCDYQLVYGNDGIVYDNNVPLTDQKCCQNYWLPTVTSSNAVVCPAQQNLIISDIKNPLGPCVVIDVTTSLSIPQSCCNKSTIGTDVVWDGVKCISQTCKNSIEGGVTEETISASNLFQRDAPTLIGEPINVTWNCYWCPPNDSIKIVCSVDDYLLLLTTTEINSLATTLGWDGTTNVSVFLNTSLSPFFTSYGCLYLDTNNDPINNMACCTLKGGVWTLDTPSNKHYCVSHTAIPGVITNTYQCSDTIFNINNVLINSVDNSLATQECCTTKGYTWTNGTVTIQNQPSMQDSLGLSYANSLGYNNYCSNCPNSLKITETLDYLVDSYNNPEDLSSGISYSFGDLYAFIVQDSGGNNLSEKCCEDYGFEYGVVGGYTDITPPAIPPPPTSRCVNCPTTTQVVNNIVINQSNTNLSNLCCTKIGGWFGFTGDNLDGSDSTGNGNPILAKCYDCPPAYYYDTYQDAVDLLISSYAGQINNSTQQNINYQLGGLQPRVVYYNYAEPRTLGNTPDPILIPLKQSCCKYIKDVGLHPQVYWDSVEGLCKY